MKKLMMLSAVCLLTLSSFGMSAKNKVENVEIRYVQWNYTCSDGHQGTFLAPSGTTHAQALEIAQHLCANGGHEQ